MIVSVVCLSYISNTSAKLDSSRFIQYCLIRVPLVPCVGKALCVVYITSQESSFVDVFRTVISDLPIFSCHPRDFGWEMRQIGVLTPVLDKSYHMIYVFVLISCLMIINFRDCMRRVVTYKSGKSLADSWKAAFFELSAKENSVSYVTAMWPLLLFIAASSKKIASL